MARATARSGESELIAAVRSAVGEVREHNEDAAYVDPHHRYFVVADGMGGRSAGEVASALAVSTVRRVIDGARDVVTAYATSPNPAGHAALTALLERAVRAADDAVLERGRADAETRGMGSTLDVVVIAGNEAFVAHVGDGRVYLLRRGRAQCLTEDHTVARVMQQNGVLSAREAAQSPMRSVLCNAIGAMAGVHVEQRQLELQAGDRLLVCTDGLYDYFPRAELGLRVGRGLAGAALDNLIAEACARGGHDNLTGILVDVTPPPAAPLTALDDEPTAPMVAAAGPLAGVPDEQLGAIVDQVLRESSKRHRLPLSDAPYDG